MGDSIHYAPPSRVQHRGLRALHCHVATEMSTVSMPYGTTGSITREAISQEWNTVWCATLNSVSDQ